MGFNKDRAIIAQNSASVAAAVTSAIITANPDHATTTESALDLFDQVREHIFNGSLDLADGNTFAERAPGISPSSPPGATTDVATTGDPGEVVIGIGKHRGKTIATVDAEEPEYLTWIVDRSNSADLKRQVKAYQATKG